MRLYRVRIITVFLIFLYGVSSSLPLSASQTLPEYEIKAAFLYQFTKFIEWPEEKASPVLNLCIFRENPFGSVLEQLQTDSGQPIRILQIKSADEPVDSCHILFINKAEMDSLKQLIRRNQARSLVTVGENQDFLNKGGIINFIPYGNKMRFEINQRRAEAEGLKISSKLLKLASYVIK